MHPTNPISYPKRLCLLAFTCVAWLSTAPAWGATATFAPATLHRPNNGIINYPSDLDAADVDGDGDLDVALSSGWTAYTYVFANDGGGDFALSTRVTGDVGAPGKGGVGRSVSFGDYDLDGDQDILWNWSIYGLRIFRGDGLGHFGSAEWYGSYPSSPHNICRDSQMTSIGLVSACNNGIAIEGGRYGGRPATGIAVGDVTGDGVDDVVAVYLEGTYSELFVLEGPGYTLQDPPIELEGWVYDVALADLNGDGALDAVASAGRIFLNDGAGSLVFAGRLIPDHEGAYNGFNVVTTDLNGDGAVDFAVSLRHDFLIYHNDGNANFSETRYHTGALGFGLKEGDFDGDGDLDLIFTENHRYGGFWLTRNTICDDPDSRDPVLCSPAGSCSGDPSTGDSDMDGVCDDLDACSGDDATGDSDLDGVCDDSDSCLGDDAAGDSDGDDVCDDEDLCAGDDLSGDTDLDGVCDDGDLCPLDPLNDVDGDGVCGDDDLCAGDDATGDTDQDQVCDDLDLCQGNDATGDSDDDSWCDASDNCPSDPNPDQADADDDDIGDVCEADTDADGVIDDDDNCPLAYNPDQANSDFDLIGDACDDDDDDDGVLDDADNCPLAINPLQEDFDDDGQGDACDGDDDADGILDDADLCPATPINVLYNDHGCSGAQWVSYECGSDADHESHGDLLSCVTHSANGVRNAGLLTNQERAAIVRDAARGK